MAEPPPGWTAPDQPDQPDDENDERGTTPASPPPPPAWGRPGPASSPAWGQPGQNGQQPGNGRPPAYGGPPPAYGGPPPACGSAPPAYGAPPPPYGAPPPGYGYGAPPPGQPPYAGYGQPGWDRPALPSGGPGIVPLRPLSIGEIYDGAVRAIRANPRTMVGLAAIVIAVVTLLGTAPQAFALSTLLNSPLTDAETADNVEMSEVASLIGAGGLAALVAILQYVIATTVVSGLLITAVAGATRGISFTPAELWARCKGRLLALIGLAIVVPLIVTLVAVAGMIPGLVLIAIPGVRAIGVILLIVGILGGAGFAVGLYLGFWAVAAPALLLENLGVVAALRRSWRLVRRSFWRVFGISLLTAVITAVVRQLFTLPFSVVGEFVGAAQDSDGTPGFMGSLVRLLISDIGTILAGAVLYPFSAGVLALLYLDLRIRREGLDVDLMRSN
jgi:hypothetical protein